MKVQRWFPLGKAYGAAFCNRVEETKRLINYLDNGIHTYVVGPRRYGKSSLCENALAQAGLPWVKRDFHLAVNEKEAEQIILNGVSTLIGKAMGTVDKLQNLIKKYVKKLNPKIVISADHFKLELALSENSSPAENIAEALFLLENLLQANKKQAVLWFDEFQEIGGMTKGKGIEGAIRHVAQETQHLSIIFSGSNPIMLTAMFEDERRPLYKLCRKLVLDRISVAEYEPHLNKATKEKWGKILSHNAFEKIMTLTERHPYYVNYLCNELWLNCDKLPTDKEITAAWTMIVEEERSDLIKDFFSLPENQRKILIFIANHGGHNLYSSEIFTKTAIPSGSVTKTLAVLVEKNYLEKVGDDYRIIVPAYLKLLNKTDSLSEM